MMNQGIKDGYIPAGGVWTAEGREDWLQWATESWRQRTDVRNLNAEQAKSILGTVAALMAALEDQVKRTMECACTCVDTETHNNGHNKGDCGAINYTKEARNLLEALR